MTRIEVVRPGLLTTVQDRGRPGLAHLGVPPSGAADPVAFELGNRLVGNPAGAAALEATLDGPVLRFDGPATVALTGARFLAPPPSRAGRRSGGGTVRERRARYVCVRGGIEVEPTLGSRSTDLLTGLGPAPLQRGRRAPGWRRRRRAMRRRADFPRACSRMNLSFASASARATTGSRRARSRRSAPSPGASALPRTASASASKGRSSSAPARTSSCRKVS